MNYKISYKKAYSTTNFLKSVISIPNILEDDLNSMPTTKVKLLFEKII